MEDTPCPESQTSEKHHSDHLECTEPSFEYPETAGANKVLSETVIEQQSGQSANAEVCADGLDEPNLIDPTASEEGDEQRLGDSDSHDGRAANHDGVAHSNGMVRRSPLLTSPGHCSSDSDSDISDERSSSESLGRTHESDSAKRLQWQQKPGKRQEHRNQRDVTQSVPTLGNSQGCPAEEELASRVAPGQTLTPHDGNAFRRLYADHRDRVERTGHRKDEAQRAQDANECKVVYTFVKRGRPEELETACRRLYEDAAARQARLQVRRDHKLRAIDDMHKAMPPARPSPLPRKSSDSERSETDEVEDDDGIVVPAWQRLYDDGAKKLKLRELAMQEKSEMERMKMQQENVHKKSRRNSRQDSRRGACDGGFCKGHELYVDGVRRIAKQKAYQAMEVQKQQELLESNSVHRGVAASKQDIQDLCLRLHEADKLRITKIADIRRMEQDLTLERANHPLPGIAIRQTPGEATPREYSWAGATTVASPSSAMRHIWLHNDAARRNAERKQRQEMIEKEAADKLQQTSVHASSQGRPSSEMENVFNRLSRTKSAEALRRPGEVETPPKSPQAYLRSTGPFSPPRTFRNPPSPQTSRRALGTRNAPISPQNSQLATASRLPESPKAGPQTRSYGVVSQSMREPSVLPTENFVSMEVGEEEELPSLEEWHSAYESVMLEAHTGQRSASVPPRSPEHETSEDEFGRCGSTKSEGGLSADEAFMVLPAVFPKPEKGWVPRAVKSHKASRNLARKHYPSKQHRNDGRKMLTSGEARVGLDSSPKPSSRPIRAERSESLDHQDSRSQVSSKGASLDRRPWRPANGPPPARSQRTMPGSTVAPALDIPLTSRSYSSYASNMPAPVSEACGSGKEPGIAQSRSRAEAAVAGMPTSLAQELHRSLRHGGVSPNAPSPNSRWRA